MQSFYPGMPRQFQVSLTNSVTVSANRTGSLNTQFGLFDWLSSNPGYATELYAIYKYARITGVKIETEVINTSATIPLLAVMAPMPSSDVSAFLTPQQVSERPRSITRTIGTSAGMNKTRLVKSWSSIQELGQPTYDRSHWLTVSQLSALSPVNPDSPVVCLSIAPVLSAATWTALINVRVTYGVQFFDLEQPSYDDASFLKAETTSIKSRPLSHPPSSRKEEMDEFAIVNGVRK
jgi:hypothetical protein